MFGLGATELLIVLALVLILFGAGKLPKVMSDIGKGVSSFKKGMNEPEEISGESSATPAKKSEKKKA